MLLVSRVSLSTIFLVPSFFRINIYSPFFTICDEKNVLLCVSFIEAAICWCICCFIKLAEVPHIASKNQNICFKAIQNGNKSNSGFEQKSVFKFLLAEKCKPCEIYRRMCDVYGEAYFSKDNVFKWAKHKFFIMSLSQKESPIK